MSNNFCLYPGFLRRNSVAGVFFCLASCSQPHYDNPHVLIETHSGDIELELFPAKAPKTVAAFLSNVDRHIYDKSSFYRVLKDEEQVSALNTGVIQGGIYQSKNSSRLTVRTIPHESTKETGLSNTDGTVSFANNGAGTASTEFFICLGDQSALDAGRGGTAGGAGYAAFGKVFKGMDIVRRIQSAPSHGDRFDEAIDIDRIKKL